jgi:hypothetical protein
MRRHQREAAVVCVQLSSASVCASSVGRQLQPGQRQRVVPRPRPPQPQNPLQCARAPRPQLSSPARAAPQSVG